MKFISFLSKNLVNYTININDLRLEYYSGGEYYARIRGFLGFWYKISITGMTYNDILSKLPE